MPADLHSQANKYDKKPPLHERLRVNNRTLRLGNRVLWSILLMMACSPLALLMGHWLPKSLEAYPAGTIFIMVTVLLAVLFVQQGVFMKRRKAWLKDVHMLSETRDTHDTELLLETLEAIRLSGFAEDTRDYSAHPDVVVAEQKVWVALLRLLRRLEPQDAGFISDNGRRILREILMNSAPYAKALARYERNRSNIPLKILDALSQIGDNRDLPALRQVASGRHNPINNSVREAAKHTIERIKARRGGEATRQELLRPSQSPVRSGQELLRPAVSVPDGQEEELLRAVENRQNS